MYRYCLFPTQLAHAFCGSSRRRGEQRFYSKLVKHREYGLYRRCLSRAGAAGYDHYLIFQRDLQRPFLHGGISDVLLFLKLFNQAAGIEAVAEPAFAHRGKPFRRIRLGIIKFRQIAGIAAGDDLKSELPA